MADVEHWSFGVERNLHSQAQTRAVVWGGGEAHGARAGHLSSGWLQGRQPGFGDLGRLEKPRAHADVFVFAGDVEGIFAAFEAEGEDSRIGRGNGKSLGAVVFEPKASKAFVLVGLGG